jgi:hypothetical protein
MKTNAFLHGYLAGYMHKQAGIMDLINTGIDVNKKGIKQGIDSVKQAYNDVKQGAGKVVDTVKGIPGAIKEDRENAALGKDIRDKGRATVSTLQSTEGRQLAALLAALAAGGLGAGAGALIAPKGKKARGAGIGAAIAAPLGAAGGYLGSGALGNVLSKGLFAPK